MRWFLGTKAIRSHCVLAVARKDAIAVAHGREEIVDLSGYIAGDYGGWHQAGSNKNGNNVLHPTHRLSLADIGL